MEQIVEQFGQVGYIMGSYAGICLQYKCFDGLSLISPAKKLACPKAALRNLLLMGFLLGNQYVHEKWVLYQDADIYILLFINSLLYNTTNFFLIFAFSDALFLKMGLYDQKGFDENVESLDGFDDTSRKHGNLVDDVHQSSTSLLESGLLVPESLVQDELRSSSI